MVSKIKLFAIKLINLKVWKAISINHMSNVINIRCRTNFTCLTLKIAGEINWLHKNFYNITNANHYQILILTSILNSFISENVLLILYSHHPHRQCFYILVYNLKTSILEKLKVKTIEFWSVPWSTLKVLWGYQLKFGNMRDNKAV